MRAWGFARVNSACEEYNFLIREHKGSSIRVFYGFWEQALFRYCLPFVGYPISRRNGHHLHFTTLDRIVNSFSMEIQFLLWLCIGKGLFDLVNLVL